MVTHAENERMCRIEHDAPMGRLMREHYWIPFAQSQHLDMGDGPLPVRLFGENYVAFRDAAGRVGFLDELCPHRRSSLVLARNEGDGLRCIYHGWKIDAAGCVLDCPTQTVRAEQFAASVQSVRFPVHESGGLAWVWFGGGETPPFPELPFGDETLCRYMCVSRVPCNWLQGIEGSIDSVHGAYLHQTWIAEAAKMAEHANLTFQLSEPPTYETAATSYGMRAAALRKLADGRTYVRITEHLMPLVTVVPVGGDLQRAGSVFVVSPVDDTHHLLFFGTYGETPHSGQSLEKIAMQALDYVPDPHDYTRLRGDVWNRWGQDRDAMNDGRHFTGLTRSLLEEDAVVQTSMGPIVDRSKENLSSSDTAVAHARRMLLDAMSAAGEGVPPPGSARSPEPVRLPNCVEMFADEGRHWDDAALDRLGS
jgi:phenylpropionate dioxygenase-like ring-hydroxylating dioxygenase large terminal subunit